MEGTPGLPVVESDSANSVPGEVPPRLMEAVVTFGKTVLGAGRVAGVVLV